MLYFTFSSFPHLTCYRNVNDFVYNIFFQDNSCAKESHKDETSDLDLELDSLRRKLESVSTLVVMNRLIIFLDFSNNCQCFLLFTRLTWSLKILKERCRHWKGKLHTKENLILLSLRYKSCLKTNPCRKILKVRHSYTIQQLNTKKGML